MSPEYVRYLREKAEQFRRIAEIHRSALSRQLLAIAKEFDAKAAEIEAGDPGDAKPC